MYDWGNLQTGEFDGTNLHPTPRPTDGSYSPNPNMPDAEASATNSANNEANAIEQQRRPLAARGFADQSQTFSNYESLASGLRQRQKREFAGRSVGLISSGGYLGTTQSHEGDLASLSRDQEMELQALYQKRDAAIAESRNAYLEKDFALAREKANLAKELGATITTQRKNAADQKIALVREARDAQKFQREESEAVAENLVPSILPQLTDNDAENEKILTKYAKQNGVDPNILIRKISDFQIAQAKDRTADQKDYEYALSRGDIPSTMKFTDWKLYDANLKFKADPDIKVDKNAENAVTVYGRLLQKAIAEGASPAEAVIAVTATAAQASGTKIDLATQAALLKYADILAKPASSGPEIEEEAPLPGEAGNIFEDFIALFNPEAVDENRRIREGDRQSKESILKQWENLKKISKTRELTEAEKDLGFNLRQQAKEKRIILK